MRRKQRLSNYFGTAPSMSCEQPLSLNSLIKTDPTFPRSFQWSATDSTVPLISNYSYDPDERFVWICTPARRRVWQNCAAFAIWPCWRRSSARPRV
jgi:hypothetical protein